MVCRKHLLTGAALTLITYTFGQNPNLDFKNAIVVYNQSTFEQDRTVPLSTNSTSLVYTDTWLTLLHPTIAFRWRSKNTNFQEIELTKLSLASTDARMENIDTTGKVLSANGNVFVTTEIQVRYEYLRTFKKQKDQRLVPSLGFAVKPGFLRRSTKYHSSMLFPTSVTSFSIEYQITPRLTYFLKQRIFIDLNFPLTLFYTKLRVNKQLDPSLPTNNQRYSTFDYEAFPGILAMRLGLGIKL